MSSSLRKSDLLASVTAELLRSYVLAGRGSSCPDISSITEQAGAILQENTREPHPIPNAVWQDLFGFARRTWSLPGWSELIKAWEGDAFRVWQQERRSARDRNKEPQRAPESPTATREEWLEIWLAAVKRGDWVPEFILADLRKEKKIETNWPAAGAGK